MAINIVCPICKEHINYVYLQVDEPRCMNNHLLGRWVMCKGSNGNHVFLSRVKAERRDTDDSSNDANNYDKCPVCGDENKISVPKGIKVKCMKVYADGRLCPTPEYSWLIDGPPCFLNHIDVILVKW